LVIHPDGKIITINVVESSGSHSLGKPSQPVTMPDEKAEAVAPYTVPGREGVPASPRQPDRVRRNQRLSPRRSTALREPRRAASRRQQHRFVHTS
jgi:hypothetical protein